MAQLASQLTVEALGTGTPDVRSTQITAEALTTATTNTRVRSTQVALEALAFANTKSRSSQMSIEVLTPYPGTPPPVANPATYTFTLSVTDPSNAQALRQFAITINPSS